MTAPGVAGFQWRMPVDVRFGAGCTSELAAQLGERSAVVMAFEPATTLGWRAQWTRDLGQRLRAWVEVPDGLSSMARCREFAEQVWPVLAAEPGTVLIALGGGTTLDIAKVLRCRPVEADPRIDQLCGVQRRTHPAGFDRVADALRGVWASVWLERAFEERDWYRIDHLGVAMGVLVQPFVEGAVATGVAITGNPYKQGLDAVFINTQWTGATVTGAQGDQLPEQYLVATWTGTFEPELISRSSLAGGAPILRDEELVDLTTQLLQVHRSLLAEHAGTANAMDVEFALTRERGFVMLQARPYRIVYSLDRAGRERPGSEWVRRWQGRLRRLAHQLRTGWRRRTVLSWQD
jgi:hypothetical protein